MATLGFGKVKFFNKVKGFGFITPEQSTTDLFFHNTQVLSKEVKDDDLVSFIEAEGKRGPCAEQVTVIV